MAAASLINSASTSVKVGPLIHVVLRPVSGPGEWIFQTTAFEPDALDRGLHGFRRLIQPPSPPAAAVGPAERRIDRLHKLDQSRSSGAITVDEFALPKADVLAEFGGAGES